MLFVENSIWYLVMLGQDSAPLKTTPASKTNLADANIYLIYFIIYFTSSQILKNKQIWHKKFCFFLLLIFLRVYIITITDRSIKHSHDSQSFNLQLWALESFLITMRLPSNLDIIYFILSLITKNKEFWPSTSFPKGLHSLRLWTMNTL